MSLCRPLGLGLAFVAVLSASPPHITIISRSGTSPLSSQAAAADYVSWTQPETFFDVTIRANLISTSGTATGNVYLTTQIGASATAAQQVATAAISTTNTAASGLPTTLLSGLTLGPGTYYVVISGTHLGFATSPLPTFVLSGGVIDNLDGYSDAPNPSYPPHGVYYMKGRNVLYSATAAPTVPVPALSPFALLATALLLLVSGLWLLRFYRPQE